MVYGAHHINQRPRNFYAYFGSMIITFFGFYGFTYLVTWITIHQTNDPRLLGNILAMTMLPAIFLNLVAGWVLQYISARSMMLVTDLLTILDSTTVIGNFLAPYLIHWFGHWTLPLLGLGLCLLICLHFGYARYQAKVTRSTSKISANE